MNGANSYNICPRCGNSNALSAKYCSRCGGQLKVPEEPVVCHKCHTHNSPMANFCRNCGAELVVGLETKICPKCGKEVDAHSNVCTCGYSFVTFQQTAPSKKPVSPEAVKLSGDKSKVYSKRGGRGWAIATMVLMLIFGYLFVAPVSARPNFLWQFDNGIMTSTYGYDYIAGTVDFFKAFGFNWDAIKEFGAANIMIYLLSMATMLTMAVQFIVCFVRIFTGRRGKHRNWYYFVMGLISLLLVGLVFLFGKLDVHEGFLGSVANVFRLRGFVAGYIIWLIPIYFWFFFFLSFGSRAKFLKEEK